MRTIEDIIADSQKYGEAALREAFEAGRASAHLELKSKLSAFVTDIMSPYEPSQETPALDAEAHHDADQHEGDRNEGDHHGGDHHGDNHQGEGHYG